jgi:uncharacterized protein (TIGR03118 family)
MNAPTAISRTCIELLECRRLLSAAPGGSVTVTNLVSDGAVAAAHVDASLLNPWGVSFAPGGEFWVSDNNSGLSTLYDGNGVKDPSIIVNIPGPAGAPGTPTGQVYTAGNGFSVQEGGGSSGPSQFVFVNEDGIISGWSPEVDASNAVVALDHSASGAVYKGATLATVGGQPELFVANFNSGKIEVYNSSFGAVSLPAKAFTDRSIHAGFAPFNVQNINGQIYVTYAKQDDAKHDDVGGAGNGFVDVFNTRGTLVRHFQHGSFLDSPWGLAKAPSTWGKMAGDILVGQFKGNDIDVFSKTGHFLGFLSDQNKNPIEIDHLWALTPGTGSPTANTNTIYFTAGPNDEADGLLGSLTFTATAKTKGVGTSPGGPFGY